MVVNCKIILDNDTVYAGGTLSGRVIYRFSSQETVKAIRLIIKGIAWIENDRIRNSSISTEDFLYEETILCGGAETPTTLEADTTYTFPFNYVLPLSIPSTFQYESLLQMIKAYLHYRITVERSKKYLNHDDAEEVFCVMKYMDLNFIPTEIKSVANVNFSKEKFWFCCTGQSIFANVRLPRRCFVPGTKIPFILECNNQSTIRVIKIIITLQLKLSYYYKKSSKPEGRKPFVIDPSKIAISQLKLGSVNDHATRTWDESLEIPVFQPLHSDGCIVVDVDYILDFKLQLSFPHRSLCTKIPITLGNVPVNDKGIPDQQPQTPQSNLTLITDLTDLEDIKIEKQID